MNRRSPQTGYHFQYSTPSRFAKALSEEKIEWPTRPAEWDMLPLIGDEMGAPWSGFFTSRPGFKALVRSSSSWWRAAQQLHAIQHDSKDWLTQFGQLLPLWKAMGLAVAHDALPGDGQIAMLSRFVAVRLANPKSITISGFGIVSDDFVHRLLDGIDR